MTMDGLFDREGGGMPCRVDSGLKCFAHLTPSPAFTAARTWTAPDPFGSSLTSLNHHTLQKP